MTYKLVYFNVRGLGEQIRYVLQDNGLPHEEEFMASEQWAKRKPMVAFGQIPMLKDGDFQIVQSAAIMRHLARKHGLYGGNSKEQTQVDIAYDGQNDLRQKYVKLIYQNYDAGKCEYTQNLPAEMDKFEKLLASNKGGKGFFVGDKITIADYAIFDVLDNHAILCPGILDKFPLLKGFHQRMATRPALAKYRSTEAFRTRNINGNGKQ